MAHITERECQALRLLKNDGYTTRGLSFMFERKEETICRHVNRECAHSRKPTVNSPGRYDDDDLLLAFRLIREQQPYQAMSPDVYDEYRPTEFPCAETISRRFGGWAAVREMESG